MESRQSSGHCIRSILSLLLIFFWFESSDGRIVVAKGAKNVLGANYANNLCPYTQAVYNGSSSPYFALKGLTISVAVNPDAPLFSFTFNKTAPNGGFLYTLVNTIATRGGFSVKWITTPAYNSYSSGTTYMTSVLPYVDIYGNVASDTVARRAVGIGFTDGVYDNSIILVAIQSTAPQELALWNFLAPFTASVWAACCGVIVSYTLLRYVYSLVDAWLDNKRTAAITTVPTSEPDPKTLDKIGNTDPSAGSLPFFFYHALGDFVQIPAAGSALPKTCAAMLLKFGYSFFILIILASYTANLASDLVSAKRASYTVESIGTANAKGQTICYLSSNSASATTLTGYPNIKQKSISVVNDPQVTLLRALKAGQCDGAVLYKTDWQAVLGTSAANPACDLVQVGESLRPFDGSFAYNQDYSAKCTALVDTVFSSVLNGMVSDGTYDNLLQQRVAATSDETCLAFSPTAGASQLSFSLLAGIFTVFGAGLALAVVVLAVSMTSAAVRRRGACRGAKYRPTGGDIRPLQRGPADQGILDDLLLVDAPSYYNSTPSSNAKANGGAMSIHTSMY